MSGTDNEIESKLDRLGEFLQRHRLDGVFLNHRASFAWITGGKDNHVPNNSQNGVAGILVIGRRRICFTNEIEEPRFAHEELAGLSIEVISYPWSDPAAGRKKIGELIAGKNVAADVMDNGVYDRWGAGFTRLPDDFAELRWSLTPAEIERYRQGGKRTAAAIEAACGAIERNMTEHEIAGVLDAQVRSRGMTPVVTLVAGDDRVAKYRHPIPTDLRVSRYCMLVTCASFAGLISNVTRLVSFVPVTAELSKRHQAVCNVDAAVNLSTRPGKTLGELFAVIQEAYGDNGFPGEEKYHHQGGSTGYNGRDVFAEPGLAVRVRENQAFAWNPSIAGVKSEDTTIRTDKGIEFLTEPGKDWPRMRATFAGDQAVERAGILQR